jgi:nucleoside-diphosphate-sugar epimerase
VDANLKAAESAKAAGQVINIANGERITLNQLLSELKSLTGKADVVADYKETRAGDVKHSLADITRRGNCFHTNQALTFAVDCS